MSAENKEELRLGCPGVGGCPEMEDFSSSRRKVIRWLGWGSLFAALATIGGGTLRFLFPRVLFEPPATFTVGRVEDYPDGPVDEHGVVGVSTEYMAGHQIWIVREMASIYAVFAKCTHLGCTPQWFPEERQFKCPCHGSLYYSNAYNFAGPAPRPMDRYAISKLEDGRILVDTTTLFKVGDFDHPRARLLV